MDEEEGVTRRERRGECFQALVNDRKLNRLPYREGKDRSKIYSGYKHSTRLQVFRNVYSKGSSFRFVLISPSFNH